MLVGIGVRPALEQRADEALGLAVGLRAIGAGLPHRDPVGCAGIRPAALEAAAVVGEHALHPNAVRAVEADELAQEGSGALGRLFAIHAGEADAGVVVDRHIQVLPAGFALRPTAAIAGDVMTGLEDASQLLDVDVHELAGRRALVADDLLVRRRFQSGELAPGARDGSRSRLICAGRRPHDRCATESGALSRIERRPEGLLIAASRIARAASARPSGALSSPGAGRRARLRRSSASAPAAAGELAGDGDRHDVVRSPRRSFEARASVGASARAPHRRARALRAAAPARRRSSADARRQGALVPGHLHEHAPRVRVAGLGDRAGG